VRPRSTLRFGIALVLCFMVGDLALWPAIETGVRVAGGWGVVPALVVLGFALALLFTVVYDGPRVQYRREARALR
jgi:hypothetical protein